MKLVCSQNDLERAVNIVSKAITPNTTLPVLNNILLKAEQDKFYFSATNLEVAIQYFIPAEVKIEGAITIPAKLLQSFINLLKSEKVEISLLENETIQITSPTSETKIKGINAHEFPTIPEVEKGEEIKVSLKELEKSITQVAFAASMNTSRPQLSGVFFYAHDNSLKMVATDSYRLAEKTLKLSDGGEVEAIIPAKTVIEFGRILGQCDDEEVTMNFSKQQAVLKVGNVSLITRLIEAKFPPYEKIIPTHTRTKVTGVTDDLIAVVRRVSLFARENNNSIKLTSTNDGKLVISTDETKIGEERAEIMVEMEGENNKVAINAQYLVDVLNYVLSEKVCIEMEDKLSPVVVKPADKGEGYVYIIMPLKT